MTGNNFPEFCNVLLESYFFKLTLGSDYLEICFWAVAFKIIWLSKYYNKILHHVRLLHKKLTLEFFVLFLHWPCIPSAYFAFLELEYRCLNNFLLVSLLIDFLFVTNSAHFNVKLIDVIVQDATKKAFCEIYSIFQRLITCSTLMKIIKSFLTTLLTREAWFSRKSGF